MKTVTFFTAAAAATALIASPALAREPLQSGGDKPVKQMKMHSSEKRMTSSARMQTREHRAGAGGMVRRDRMTAHDGWNNRGWNEGRDWNHRGWASGNWDDRGWDRRGSGFWPADVVGGAVGAAGAITTGAVNTAGAIATAPFGGPYREGYRDSYAFDGSSGYADTYAYNYNGTAMPQSSSYAARNGFVCQPGTITRAKNGSGAAVICQ